MSISIGFEIERLINFALQNDLIEMSDIIYIRNHYMYLFKETNTKTYTIDEQLDYPDSILEQMYEYVITKNLDLGDNKDIITCKIMDILVPRPSIVQSKFTHAYINYDIKQALEYFYNLSVATNYIKSSDITRNHHWISNTKYGDLEITINLSKPEKDPKDIIKAKLQPVNGYPSCLLCLENEGFSGDYNRPSRFTHRVIPFCLNGETWYFQFSPYAYYTNHSIIFSSLHRDMKININTFKALFDFVDYVPHFIIGANADIPIVGGSILSHDHFQAGSHVFPMEQAQTLSQIKWKNNPDVHGAILHWPLSVIKLIGNKTNLLKLGNEILDKWINYNDLTVDIISHSTDRHNTLNPIVRKISDDKYEMYLILRNNRVSKDYPDGIFHPHKEFHHLKKENIGLIEAMGLAILPGRLEQELKQITNIIDNKTEINNINETHPLWPHKDFILGLIKKANSTNTTKQLIQEEVAKKFMQVLECSGVFKNNTIGVSAFKKFITHTDGEINN